MNSACQLLGRVHNRSPAAAGISYGTGAKEWWQENLDRNRTLVIVTRAVLTGQQSTEKLTYQSVWGIVGIGAAALQPQHLCTKVFYSVEVYILL